MTFVQGTFRAGALVAVVAALGAAPQVQTPRQTPRQTQTPAPTPTPTLPSASTDRVLYIHAGAVLDRPGQPPPAA
jgi:hypothetical protein